MKRFSVICLQCGLNVDRLIDAETAQTEIHPVTYQQKCKIAPNAADFDCPELERAVERSRRWDPISGAACLPGHDLHAYEAEQRAGFEAWCSRLMSIVEPGGGADNVVDANAAFAAKGRRP
jgi:hypothetical protein